MNELVGDGGGVRGGDVRSQRVYFTFVVNCLAPLSVLASVMLSVAELATAQERISFRQKSRSARILSREGQTGLYFPPPILGHLWPTEGH
jgi:hypothetical protein